MVHLICAMGQHRRAAHANANGVHVQVMPVPPAFAQLLVHHGLGLGGKAESAFALGEFDSGQPPVEQGASELELRRLSRVDVGQQIPGSLAKLVLRNVCHD